MDTGIYCIINTVNNLFYIGSSSVTLKWRMYTHRYNLNKNKHINYRLQNDWKLYGEGAFLFKIIEVCQKDKCIEREQYYIDTTNPYYNIMRKAGSTLGYKYSPEVIEKIRKRNKGRIPWNKGNKKIVPIDITRQKKRDYQRERRKDLKRLSSEEKSQIQQNASSRNKPVIRSDGIQFKSVRDAARIMNITHGQICRGIKRSLNVHGFKFKYKDILK